LFVDCFAPPYRAGAASCVPAHLGNGFKVSAVSICSGVKSGVLQLMSKLMSVTLCWNVATVGEWALVTGASYGIGSGYAIELSKRGVNVRISHRTAFT